MSPSMASIVSPLSSPAVLSIAASSSVTSLLRLRSWTVVLQRELDRHAVALLHALEGRRREMQQHPALCGLDEEPPLLRIHAGDLARYRVSRHPRLRRRLRHRRLRGRDRGVLRKRETREEQTGCDAG